MKIVQILFTFIVFFNLFYQPTLKDFNATEITRTGTAQATLRVIDSVSVTSLDNNIQAREVKKGINYDIPIKISNNRPSTLTIQYGEKGENPIIAGFNKLKEITISGIIHNSLIEKINNRNNKVNDKDKTVKINVIY